MQKRNMFFGVLCFLAGMGMLFLAYDIWQVATSTVNLKEHLPFLMPLFFILMIGIVLRIQIQHEEQEEKEETE